MAIVKQLVLVHVNSLFNKEAILDWVKTGMCLTYPDPFLERVFVYPSSSSGQLWRSLFLKERFLLIHRTASGTYPEAC
jgi:hypothetical protein